MTPSTRWLWLLRVTWLLLAVASLPAYAGALDGRSGAVQLVSSTGLWIGWAIVLVATLVPSPPSLTVVRLLTPAAPVAAVVVDGQPHHAHRRLAQHGLGGRTPGQRRGGREIGQPLENEVGRRPGVRVRQAPYPARRSRRQVHRHPLSLDANIQRWPRAAP